MRRFRVDTASLVRVSSRIFYEVSELTARYGLHALFRRSECRSSHFLKIPKIGFLAFKTMLSYLLVVVDWLPYKQNHGKGYTENAIQGSYLGIDIDSC